MTIICDIREMRSIQGENNQKTVNILTTSKIGRVINSIVTLLKTTSTLMDATNYFFYDKIE